jgi:diguanylate cyclase (GGDEF)-like protein
MCGLEAAAALLCVARGILSKSGRAVPIVLGLALLAWTIGDVLLTSESLGGAEVSVPSAADALYLSFYPLAYVATALLLRRALGRLSRANWLDGAVAGLGAAAVCAAFAFHSIQQAANDGSAAAITHLAYPIGDLLLLSLVIGGCALLAGNRTGPWTLLAAGISINVVGDTFNLFQYSEYATRVGADLNAIAWPASILAISMAVWLHPGSIDAQRQHRVAGFALPGIAAAAALIVLSFGTLHPVSRVALVLAFATLAVVGVRLALSARSLRVLTEEQHLQAVTDELTSLGNRRQLFNRLESLLARDPGGRPQQVAFLFVDLNRFKEINDSYGHSIGDELLRELGPRLARGAGDPASVFRLGGDEFAIVLADADAAAAEAVALRIQAEFEQPFGIENFTVSVGASIGIALTPSDAVDGNELLWCADIAMYRAKFGASHVAFYDQRLDGGESQLDLLVDLQGAIERGEMVLYYQPQLDQHAGRVGSVEALIRWRHPSLGLIPPLRFLQLVEDAGLMRALTAWVIDEALAQCAAWRRDGLDVVVSVNVSQSNLLEEGFAASVGRQLDRHGLGPDALVVEITETMIITDFDGARSAIAQLAELGVVVSVDDFGAGFTSLAYLSALSVGELKLDRSFIIGLSTDRSGQHVELVKSTVQLGHDMGLRVVAEGVEDAETLELVQECGCDLVQGYLVGRPMPADRVHFGRFRSPAENGSGVVSLGV